MRWRWVITVVLLALFGLLATVGVVVVRTPIGFTVTAPGTVEPARTMRVIAPQSGRIVFVQPEGSVHAGTVLVRQKTEHEQRRLAALADRLEGLRRELALEKDKLTADREAVAVKKDRLKLDRKHTEAQLEYERSVLQKNDAELRHKALEQLEVRRQLAESECATLQKLARELSVPQQDLARAETEAAAARLAIERATLEHQREQAASAHRLTMLELERQRQRLAERELEGSFQDISRQLALERQIVELENDMTDLRASLVKRELRAPWDGRWTHVTAAADEYVMQGHTVGVLEERSKLRFIGHVPESQFAWLRRGQTAKVRFRAYPYLKYGALNAVVVDIQSVVGTAQGAAGAPQFIVTIDLPREHPVFKPVPGQNGRADIVVFRGTLIDYLRAEPSDALSGRAEPAAEQEPVSNDATPDSGP